MSLQQAQRSQRAGARRATRRSTGPARTSLNSLIASPCVRPAVPRPFTDIISSPSRSIDSAACPLLNIVLTKIPISPRGESLPPTILNPKPFPPADFVKRTSKVLLSRGSGAGGRLAGCWAGAGGMGRGRAFRGVELTRNSATQFLNCCIGSCRGCTRGSLYGSSHNLWFASTVSRLYSFLYGTSNSTFSLYGRLLLPSMKPCLLSGM